MNKRSYKINNTKELVMVIVVPFILPIITYYFLAPETSGEGIAFFMVAFAEYFAALTATLVVLSFNEQGEFY